MTPRELRHRLRLQGMRLWILAALVVYSIVGFVLVPWVVRRQLVDFVQQDLGRRLALERVRFNPYTFALRVLGFDMEESDGTPLLAFGELLVDFEPGASLVQRAWDFGEITLRAPRINYVRFTSGDDNFGRLVSDLQKPAEEEEAAPAEPTGVPRVVIAKIAVEDAAIDVADRSRRTPFTTHLGPGGFVVHDLTTLPEHEGRHTLELTTESGARLGWDGTFAANPVRSSGHVSARGERLRLLWRYLQDQVRFEVVEGSAVLELDYTMSATAEGLGAEVSNLTYDLRDLLVRPKGEPTDVLAVREIVVRGGHLSWPARRAGLAEVRIAGTRLALWREPDGTINLSNLITSDEADEGAGKADAGSEPRPDAPPTAGESPSPWELTLDRLLFEDCNISVEDRTFPDPVRTGLDGLRLEARKLSSVPGSRFDFSLETTVTTGGRLGCEGSVGLDPPVTDARVVLRDLALPPAQPYLAQVARLVLESGALSLESRLSTTSEEQLRFDGKVSVSGRPQTLDANRLIVVAGQHGWKPPRLASSWVDYDRMGEARPDFTPQRSSARLPPRHRHAGARAVS